MATLLGTMSMGSAAEQPGLTFYVSPQGKDAWTGKLASPNRQGSDGPFATLTAARDAIRPLIAAGQLPRGGVTVMVQAGEYTLTDSFELTAADSGSPTRPIIYRAAPGATVRIIGGRTLPAEAFSPLQDEKILARLAPEVRGKIMSADLKALGLSDLGSFPVKYRGAPAAPELFFNDQRMTLARWPNEGWARIAKIIQTGSIPRTGDKGNEPGIFEYAEEEPGRWQVDQGVWLQGYWCFDWYDETIQIKAIDPQTRRITLAVPTLYGVKQGNPSPRRYKALNVLEELNTPGEYYLDRALGKVYFYPPGPLAGSRITLSTLNAPLFKLTDVSHVTLRGFTFEAGLHNGLSITGGTRNQVLACVARNLRATGIVVQGGTLHRLEACDIYDTGTGGVILAGGDRKTLTPGGHEAVNCHIWNYSVHQLTYANAFLLQGVGQRVAHCLIHDAPHQAIGVGGNDHIFEYNELYNICTETDDCGAYYKGRNPSCRGNIVRYNFFYNIGSPMGHGNAAVYFDDGDGGDFVIGNLFFRCGDPGKGSFGTVFSHGGHGLTAEDNIFLECKRPLGSAPWNDKRWKESLNPQLLLQDVDITSEVYLKRYPELAGYMDPQPGQPRVSLARRNVLALGASVSSGNWQVSPEENWITDQDPGFVDAAKGNFNLRPGAEVFRRLPGFQAPPFAKMGLYQDELRPVVPVRSWNFPPPKQLEPLTRTVAQAAVKRGPAPVFQIKRLAAAPTIDGQRGGSEYPEPAMELKVDVMGNPAIRHSRAWLGYDAQALYVLVDNAIQPDTDLTGNRWGQNDAIEIAVQIPREGKQPPIYVLRGYVNGRLEFGSTPNGQEDPLTMEPGPIVYKQSHPEKGRWLAEVSIPFSMLDLDPATTSRVRFSLAVRKTKDDLWLMWAPTQGHSYDVSTAGLLEFVK
jgi:hypothetical protein